MQDPKTKNHNSKNTNKRSNSNNSISVTTEKQSKKIRIEEPEDENKKTEARRNMLEQDVTNLTEKPKKKFTKKELKGKNRKLQAKIDALEEELKEKELENKTIELRAINSELQVKFYTLKQDIANLSAQVNTHIEHDGCTTMLEYNNPDNSRNTSTNPSIVQAIPEQNQIEPRLRNTVITTGTWIPPTSSQSAPQTQEEPSSLVSTNLNSTSTTVLHEQNNFIEEEIDDQVVPSL